MKKFLIPLLLVAILVGVLIATCPDEQQHRDIANDRIDTATAAYLEEKGVPSEGILGMLSYTIGGMVGRMNISSKFEVKDCLLFSYGTIDFTGDDKHLVTLGVFNHVFCFVSEEKAQELIKENADK